MKKYKVCGNGHFLKTKKLFCQVCKKEKQTLMSVYDINAETRAMMPSVFGYEEAQRCADIIAQVAE